MSGKWVNDNCYGGTMLSLIKLKALEIIILCLTNGLTAKTTMLIGVLVLRRD